MLVLSAKNIGLPCSMPTSRSLVTGPRTEPCGMPWLMGLFWDITMQLKKKKKVVPVLN
jgi:hypothetical protein